MLWFGCLVGWNKKYNCKTPSNAYIVQYDWFKNFFPQKYQDDEDDIEDKKPETPVKPTKRKRGRPPKNKKSSEGGASSNDKSNDPYEFDADEGTSGQMRSSSGDKGKSYRMSGGGGKKPKEAEDDEESALASRNNVSI